MILEQKLIEAKAKRRDYFFKIVAAFATSLLLCVMVILFISSYRINDKAENVSPSKTTEINKKNVAPPTAPDEQLRQTYINTLSNYENTLKPELNKIDLTQWSQPQSQQLDILEDEALSKFSAADYASAISSINELTHLAQTMIKDSQQEFEQALSSAQNAYDAYDADQYEDAKFQIASALILNKTSVEAKTLSSKIDKLPETLTLLEKINTARIENQPEKELKLIKELVKLAPDRKTAIERKQTLTASIKNKNYKSSIAQSYQAIKQGNARKAKQKISTAQLIFPNHHETGGAVLALQKLEKKQRLETYQQKAKIAIASDDWITAKKQLQLASQEQAGDKAIQKTLLKAATIIALNNEFEQQIKNPYRLSNKQLTSRIKNKIAKASELVNASPSLDKKKKQLSHLIESMNKKIAVEVTSDNQTNILVRGVGIVGITSLKTIQLTPGRYTFEGKRKGFKSKLIDVLIPYSQTRYRVNIHCDEPI